MKPLSEITAGTELSLVLLKPDAVERDIALHVLHRIEREAQGVIRATRTLLLTRDQLAEHYAHIVHLPCFPSIVRYMTRTPVLAAVMQGGCGVIGRIRTVLGATDPAKAAPDTIRGLFGHSDGDVQENVAHASGSMEEALSEIRRFFTREQLLRDAPDLVAWVFPDGK